MGQWAGDHQSGWAARTFRASSQSIRACKIRCPLCGEKKTNLLAHALAKHPDTSIREMFGDLEHKEKVK